MALLSRIFGRDGGARAEPAPVDSSTLAPDAPFVAIGDVHGRLDLLEPRLKALEGERVILVGDYVDRGADSAGVLRLMQRLTSEGRVTCLTGNHEIMLLKFLDEPVESGSIWLRNGGVETLWSFGIEGIDRALGAEGLMRLAEELRDRLGPLEDWMREVPMIWRSGNVAVVHAATEPSLPIDAQPPEMLIWGRPRPGTPPRPDGIWVVHGHTIVPEVEITQGRVNCDTGAYATDRLSAVRISPGSIEVLG